MKHFVITFRFTDKQIPYIRNIRNYIESDGNMVLTPQAHLISKELLFTDAAKAQVLIDKLVKLNSDALKLCIASGIPPKSTYEYTDYRKFKRQADASRYTIVEYTPEFIFKRSRKSNTKEWVACDTMSVFCHVCGTNAVAGKYFKVGTSRICMFCLKALGNDAQKMIDELKKEHPDIEDGHMATTFLGHMDD